MTWLPDMGTRFMTLEGEHIRAIGWLSDQHPFPVGDASPTFLDRLKEFCHRSGKGLELLKLWAFSLGFHECELCGDCRTNGEVVVPSGSVLFVAPLMITHYVEAHRYAPPPEFVAAVLSAPLPGTPEYHEAVSAFPELKLRHRRAQRTSGSDNIAANPAAQGTADAAPQRQSRLAVMLPQEPLGDRQDDDTP